MIHSRSAAHRHDKPILHEIRLEGHFDTHWDSWFGNLIITRLDNGETHLIGPITDQAELFGFLRRVHDLKLPLLAVNRIH